MKEIELSKGHKALVDDDIHEELNQYKWSATEGNTGIVYAQRSIRINGKRTTVMMHRQIMGVADTNVHVDHIDHNGINNVRSNLRICTPSQNRKNGSPRKGGTSNYLGVCLDRHRRRDKVYEYWKASIKIKDRYKTIGLFKTEKEAAEAYNQFALKVHGEFANLNIIKD